ncbi:hypothetical protein MNBD_GAMMA01-180 [hydrothermal vent metagenome]|uniref:Uncharacterized protein n=1 Tax=hydrothermal vent metagenome TaxID=652676 RepID=A0A3B0V674_9ZZZZ
MPIIGLMLIIQIAFAVHVVKTGRELYWVYIIILIPGIGVGIYFFTQVLPEIGQSRTVHTAKNSLIKALDPQRELRKKKTQLELANTLDNKLKLAQECLEANMPKDAIELFQACLTGVGQGDADTMVKLAQAHFINNDYQQTLQVLDEITSINPDYKSTDGHLLYARSLEKLNKFEEALQEYAIVSENYPGEEARVRYGLLLLQMDKTDTANQLFNQTISRSKLAPKFYQKKEKYWIKLAKSNLQKI